MTRTGLYTGSFDPLTNGHAEVIAAASRLCDRLVVGVGTHASKSPLLSTELRLALIEAVCAEPAKEQGCALEARAFGGLAVEAARQYGAGLIVRGVRDNSDLDDELRMVGMNAAMAPDIRTVLIPASAATRSISGTLVRQIALMGGDVSPFVPPAVVEALRSAVAAASAGTTATRR